MPIYEAELGEIIRAERRDEKQLNYLREEFSSIAKVCCLFSFPYDHYFYFFIFCISKIQGSTKVILLFLF